MDVIIGAAVADGKVTPKVQSLIKILLKYQQTEDFRAIIFVERVVAALVLPKVAHMLEQLIVHIFSRWLFTSVLLASFSSAMFCSVSAGFCRASISKFYQVC